MKNQNYKVILADTNGNQIWTADPVSSSDFASFTILTPVSGNPNGNTAGTAGSAGVEPSTAWDYTNNVWYVCTTTGNAANAVWTAINAQVVPGASVPHPQGYLTPTSGTPIIAADVASATALFYTPYIGNLVPIYGGAAYTPTTFTELTLTLTSSHAINTIYDVFIFSNSGVLTLATGPAWSNSGAGTGARGTGAGTTQLSRTLGFYLNAVAIPAAINGANTYSIPASRATYLGSIFIDGVAGQVTCHTSYGQSRKWGIWNAFNRAPIQLQGGDSTASWTYGVATIRESNGATTNNLTTFCGLAEELIDLSFAQQLNKQKPSNTTTTMSIGIGVNSTTAYSGFVGTMNVFVNTGTNFITSNITCRAEHSLVPGLGINTINALEKGDATDTDTFFGTNANMLLRARWRG